MIIVDIAPSDQLDNINLKPAEPSDQADNGSFSPAEPPTPAAEPVTPEPSKPIEEPQATPGEPAASQPVIDWTVKHDPETIERLTKPKRRRKRKPAETDVPPWELKSNKRSLWQRLQDDRNDTRAPWD